MFRSRSSLDKLVLATLLAAVTLAGCTRRSARPGSSIEIGAAVEVSPDPAQVGLAELHIYLTDAEDDPLTGADFIVRGDMTHAGMVPVLSKTEELAPGVYRTMMEWTMAGDWILTMEGTLVDGTPFLKQVDVRVAP